VTGLYMEQPGDELCNTSGQDCILRFWSFACSADSQSMGEIMNLGNLKLGVSTEGGRAYTDPESGGQNGDSGQAFRHRP
jgi:hypothetical protein